jgi:uncharacterized membrane protein
MDPDATRDATTPAYPPILAVPIGLWLFSLGADVMYRSGRGPARWDDVAFFTMFAGLVVALLTAVPGFIDELAGTGPRRMPSRRLRLNFAIVALYVLNLGVRAYAPSAILPVWMSFAGVALLATTGWLGGELMQSREAGAVRLALREVRIETRRRRTPRSA